MKKIGLEGIKKWTIKKERKESRGFQKAWSGGEVSCLGANHQELDTSYLRVVPTKRVH